MLILRQRKATHALASKKIGRGLACGARRGAEGDMLEYTARMRSNIAIMLRSNITRNLKPNIVEII